ncbi:Leucine-rich repeat receptor-like serine/threonine/tyrosine-protein kinase sobir1 [Ranunculus cassubicifolius]
MNSFPAQIIIVFLISLISLTHSTPNLHRSDADSLINLSSHLRFNRSAQLCNSVNILCQIRILHNTPVLRVTRIVFNSEQLTGSLSAEIGRLTELKELSLSNNNLVDRIPKEIVKCKHMEILNLRNNRFSGEIPKEFSSLVSLRTLDLSSNRFSGNLNFLKYFPNLENLHLSNNLFSGKIPVSLRNFRNLRVLNLSGNNELLGSVPQELNGWVDVEYSLPKRYIFAEKNGTSSRNGTRNGRNATVMPPAAAPKAAPKKSSKKKDNRNLKGWIIGFFVGLVTGMISGLIFSVLFKILLICIKGRVRESGPVLYSSLIKNAEDLAFLEQEDGVASLELIGRGGCGEVYRRELYPSDGEGSHAKVIAIKKIIQPNLNQVELSEEDTRQLTKKMRQVRTEIQTVGEIRHRNLLPLLAHVPRPDCHYLVYEFMRNGSLHDLLKEVNEGKGKLDWSVRHKIAIGVAAGLEYLHMHHTPKIIHRDLKPANILLDDDMEARIADFGLAASMPDANTHITTSNVAGTVGYIAPEYHQTLKFTDKCDIYSFGVVLAVLVMGKFPSDEFFQSTDEMYLVKWLRNVMLSENPSRAIDPTLLGNGFEDQMLLVLKIAWFCTLDEPKQRPNSKDIRIMLEQVKH